MIDDIQTHKHKHNISNCSKYEDVTVQILQEGDDTVKIGIQEIYWEIRPMKV